MRFMALAAALLSTSALAAPADDFRKLLDDHWAWYLSTNPLQATDLGVRSFDDRIGDPTLAEADRQAATATGFIARIDAIAPAGLTPADRVNRAILRRMLAEQVEGNGFGQRAMTFTTYYGWHTGFAGFPESAPLSTKADYLSYLARLNAFPAYNRAQIAVTRSGLKSGHAQPCAPLKGFETSISAHVVDTVEKSVFWAPFARAKPGVITDSDWADMQARARTAIMGGVVPAYREFLDFYTRDYAPKCRATVGIGATPGGPAYYAYRARVMTTTDLTPDAIHQIGLSEVARINAAMDKVVADSGFAGDRAAFVRRMRTDPQFYAKTPQELLEKTAFVTKQIDDWMPKLLGKLPRLPFSVKAIPADQAEGTTTAYSEWGSVASGRAGVYRVNTSRLDQRPLYELPALTMHEAAPGHQTQGSLQQELDLPAFRKYQASFTAFVEGWALYTESLGEDIGLYDTPEKKMGRYSYEMWRACRLVVDTGIHAKGWSRQQAIDYMTANTALSPHNIEAEVNRYITWPGQALAYKVGELTIKRLRAKAERQLGEKFDMRAFHDAILGQGPVPMDVLEVQIDDWIATRKGDRLD